MLGKTRARVAVEAVVDLGWELYTELDGRFVGMHSFGASGKIDDVYNKFDITRPSISMAKLGLGSSIVLLGIRSSSHRRSRNPHVCAMLRTNIFVSRPPGEFDQCPLVSQSVIDAVNNGYEDYSFSKFGTV